MGGLGCQNLLVSGGSDGLLVVWAAEQQGGTGVVREIGPKINVPKVKTETKLDFVLCVYRICYFSHTNVSNLCNDRSGKE